MIPNIPNSLFFLNPSTRIRLGYCRVWLQTAPPQSLLALTLPATSVKSLLLLLLLLLCHRPALPCYTKSASTAVQRYSSTPTLGILKEWGKGKGMGIRGYVIPAITTTTSLKPEHTSHNLPHYLPHFFPSPVRPAPPSVHVRTPVPSGGRICKCSCWGLVSGFSCACLL